MNIIFITLSSHPVVQVFLSSFILFVSSCIPLSSKTQVSLFVLLYKLSFYLAFLHLCHYGFLDSVLAQAWVVPYLNFLERKAQYCSHFLETCQTQLAQNLMTLGLFLHSQKDLHFFKSSALLELRNFKFQSQRMSQIHHQRIKQQKYQMNYHFVRLAGLILLLFLQDHFLQCFLCISNIFIL